MNQSDDTYARVVAIFAMAVVLGFIGLLNSRTKNWSSGDQIRINEEQIKFNDVLLEYFRRVRDRTDELGTRLDAMEAGINKCTCGDGDMNVADRIKMLEMNERQHRVELDKLRGEKP